MSYIGNTQQNQSYYPAVDFFSGNGSTTAFTLSRPVYSTPMVQVTVANVPQNPGSAFTISGSTITFTSAPPSGSNNIYVYYTSPNTSVATLPQSPSIVGTLSVSGNVAVNSVTSGWGNTVNAVGVSTNGYLMAIPLFAGVGNGLYYDNTNWRYKTTGVAASMIGFGSGSIAFYRAPSGTADATVSLTQMAVLDANGDFTIGATAAGTVQTRLNLQDGTELWQVGPSAGYASGTNFYVINSSGTGVFINSGNTSWSASSDERLKTDLVPIEDAANKVSTLRAVTGRFKTDEEGRSRSFLIAQDVQAVLPEAVTVQPDEDGTLAVQYTDVIPLLVAAIKELTARVEQLEAK